MEIQAQWAKLRTLKNMWSHSLCPAAAADAYCGQETSIRVGKTDHWNLSVSLGKKDPWADQ